MTQGRDQPAAKRKASPPPQAPEVQATEESEEAYEVVPCLPDRPDVRSLPLFLPLSLRVRSVPPPQ